jgi:tRNA wybutosine-synthesizing protein 2
VGDVALAKFLDTVSNKDKKKIAQAALAILQKLKTVCEIKRIEGSLREPKICVIASQVRSKKTETVHTESGVQFALDVAKIMFSKGNVAERARLAAHVMPGETIVDMFAGIGYFSLGIAKAQPSAKVFAIEKNTTAFRYLKKNIGLNGLSNVIPVKGDCRKAKLEQKADRVLMGYFPGTESYLPSAFALLGDRGIIHYHNIYKEAEMLRKPLEELEAAAKKSGYRFSAIIGQRTVKSYAPRTFHVVIDAAFEKVVA